MQQLSGSSRALQAMGPSVLTSGSRRRLVVQASDAQGPGIASRPPQPPSMQRPAAPQPQLQPLPAMPRPTMAPQQPMQQRPMQTAPGNNGGPAGLTGPPRPAMVPPGQSNQSATAPRPPMPQMAPPAARPMTTPGQQQVIQPPAGMRPLAPPQQPAQQQQQTQQQMRPGMARPAAPGMQPLQPQQPPRPQQMPQQQQPQQISPPLKTGLPGMQQQQMPQMQRPGQQMAPPPQPMRVPASTGTAQPPQPSLQPPPALGAQRPAAPQPMLTPKPALPGSSALAPKPSMQPPRAAAAAGGIGLAPKPMMPPPPAAGGGGAVMPPRPPMMAPPGQVGLNRPQMPSVQPLQRPVPPPAGGPLSASTIEIRRPEAPAQQPATARTDIGMTRPPAAPAQEEAKPRATGRLGRFEVIEEDGDIPVDEDEEEEGKGKKGKKKKGKKEKVTAEMKRAARKQREMEREEKAASSRREREEIFEVGDEGMSLEALADAIQVDSSDIVKTLFMKGIMLSMNQVLDKNTVKLVAAEYDLLVVDKEEAGVTAGAVKTRDFLDLDDLDDAVPRPPVVTVMGHVDHGKTSLLDFIRKAKVAAGEAGGITQAIGAYNVDVEVDGDKKTICFLDTPGHEAFSAMRARGARVTDIAIIIVAADDGVQPQTREAVSHAQAAEVPIVVAVNKIDKPGADVERAKQGLLEMNLVPEEWGGNTPMVPVSAKKGTGIDDLLQTVLWVAEEKQLMANPNKKAAGTVIEAHLDKKRGAVATMLVQTGTLRVGDIVSAGATHGKVRSLSNAAGRPITEAGPSIAVQLIGLNAVPQAGDEFQAHANESDARAAAETASEGLRQARIAEMSTTGSMVTLSSLATMDEDVDTLQRMNLIIKGDTSGVVEAIKGALSSLPQESVVLRYLLSAAGDITTSDVDLAAASNGMVVGFNLSPDEAVLSHAKRLGVTINTYKVIYNLIDDVKAAMEGKLRQVEEKVPIGSATVKASFGTGKKKVAGCLVEQGKLQKGAQIEVIRNKAVVHTGKIASLRRIKDNVDEVQSGLECGVGAEDFTSWQEGDSINCYMLVSKSQRLEDARAATAVDLSTIGV